MTCLHKLKQGILRQGVDTINKPLDSNIVTAIRTKTYLVLEQWNKVRSATLKTDEKHNRTGTPTSHPHLCDFQDTSSCTNLKAMRADQAHHSPIYTGSGPHRTSFSITTLQRNPPALDRPRHPLPTHNAYLSPTRRVIPTQKKQR